MDLNSQVMEEEQLYKLERIFHFAAVLRFDWHQPTHQNQTCPLPKKKKIIKITGFIPLGLGLAGKENN